MCFVSINTPLQTFARQTFADFDRKEGKNAQIQFDSWYVWILLLRFRYIIQCLRIAFHYVRNLSTRQGAFSLQWSKDSDRDKRLASVTAVHAYMGEVISVAGCDGIWFVLKGTWLRRIVGISLVALRLFIWVWLLAEQLGVDPLQLLAFKPERLCTPFRRNTTKVTSRLGLLSVNYLMYPCSNINF